MGAAQHAKWSTISTVHVAIIIQQEIVIWWFYLLPSKRFERLHTSLISQSSWKPASNHISASDLQVDLARLTGSAFKAKLSVNGALYSRTSIIRPSIIRNLDYPAWQFSCYQIRKWACPSNAHARCSCYHGDMPAYLLRMRRQPCGTAVYQ